jgi:signal recognition particle subunit SRP54
MFENLTDRLSQTIRQVRGQARLTEDNIKDTLREVRKALLEAEDVMKSLTPGQAFIKIVQGELVKLMGEANEELDLNVRPPAVVLVAGLQGSGKTTSVGKLSRWLVEKKKKSVMVTSADIYRPAAIDQLETLAGEVGASFFPSNTNQDPVDIANNAIDAARKQAQDVLIVDTAGRLHIDDQMMQEIKRLHDAVNPVETLFVVDSMTGQDAANTAKAFNDALPLTGVILTKTDGDARGGAALSIRQITGKPIKFLGVGEKTTALEPFHPDRMASRILGMGDVLSLIEEAEQKVDKAEAERLARKVSKGKGFNLEDFRSQLQQMQNMGGLAGLMDKMPGMSGMTQAMKNQVDDKHMKRLEAIINSMTPHERRFPKVINGSRKKRIATGSGTQVQDVNRLLKQFTQMQKMMKKMSKGGMKNMMRGMKGRLPPGMPF